MKEWGVLGGGIEGREGGAVGGLWRPGVALRGAVGLGGAAGGLGWGVVGGGSAGGSVCDGCAAQIRNILKQGIETPEDQNDLRKMQLRELARLNGTLREDDNRWGSHCPISAP